MIGETVSHYKIVEKLGEGGMGVVYKAFDTKLERFVALKFLPASASSDAVARFRQEAKAISALSHPGIATIHDIDEKNGRRFLVLELIPGGTLRSKLDELRQAGKLLALDEALRYSIQLTEALAAAHHAGIVHRDVKPDNAMLTRDDNIKLTDFGLAKLQHAVQITQAGNTVGTAAYMAPEQLRGEEADARADLFSVGVVMYELFTQRLPFRGEHPAALAYSIIHEEPPPPESFRPDIPPLLSAIILRCLEKDPAKRYQSADELADELRRSTEGGAKAVGVRSPRRLKRGWLIATAVVIVAAATAYFFKQLSPTTGKESKTIAVLPFINLSGKQEDEYFSDGITEDILTQLVKIAELKVISRTTMMQYKGVKKSLREIGKELKAGVILEGSVRRDGDFVRIVAQLVNAANDEHLWAETYDREYKQVLAVQSEIARRIAVSLEATLSPSEQERLSHPATTSAEAYTAYLQGRYFLDRKSKESVAKAVSYFEEALRLDSNYAQAWVGLSLAHGTQADYGYLALEEGYSKALREAARALQLDPTLADAHTNIGWIKKNYSWDWAGADAAFRRAVELEPGNAAAVRGASSIAFALGRLEEALQLANRAIELDPLNPGGYYNAGSYAYYLGKYDEAERAYRKANELSPQYPVGQMGLCLTNLMRGKFEQALAEIEKESTEPWRSQGLALVYHALGRAREADSILAQFIIDNQALSAFQIAEVYAYRGEVNKALDWLERAFNQRDGGFAALKGNPFFRRIEKHPRYSDLLKKAKLPL